MEPINHTLLLIDPTTSGISGDMIVAALLDLGAVWEEVERSAQTVGKHLPGGEKVEVRVEETLSHGLRARRFIVEAEEKPHHRTGSELLGALNRSLGEVSIPGEGKSLALKILMTLLKAEAKIHASTIEDVELHELGSVDTLIDILAAVTALSSLRLGGGARALSLPVNTGGGWVEGAHGMLPVPSPITLEILRRFSFPFQRGAFPWEAATPTGVAILVNLAQATTTYPLITPLRVGYGAGGREAPEAPNLLRVILAKEAETLLRDEVQILETNLDDTTGEVLGYLTEKLLREGARDVTIIPALTKKGRPSSIVRVICDGEKVSSLSEIIFNETGTLGLRLFSAGRHLLRRETLPVTLNVGEGSFEVRVKVSKTAGGLIHQIKPEYEDVKTIATATGLPLRMVGERARVEAEKILSKKGNDP